MIARAAADRVQHRTSQPRIFMNGQRKVANGQPIRAKWGEVGRGRPRRDYTQTEKMLTVYPMIRLEHPLASNIRRVAHSDGQAERYVVESDMRADIRTTLGSGADDD